MSTDEALCGSLISADSDMRLDYIFGPREVDAR